MTERTDPTYRKPHKPSKSNLHLTATIAKASAAVVFGAIALRSDQPINLSDFEKGEKFGTEKPEIFTPEPTATINPTSTYEIPTVSNLLTSTPENSFFEPNPVIGTTEKLKDYEGYRVVGNKIYNPREEEIIFRGYDRASFDWGYGDHVASPEEAGYPAMHENGANVVRLNLNQIYWLTDPAYKAIIDQQVKWANEVGLNVILDLHWSGKGDLKDGGQQQMPDMHSLDFWKDVSVTYKDNPSVLFELYNEPHIESDNAADIWANGGMVSDGYNTPGMQKIVDVIRSEGALNIVILNGLNWGFDHSGLPPIKGVNIIKGAHPYGMYSEKDSEDDFDKAFGFLIDQGEAVMITEFGDTTSCDSDFYKRVTNYALKKGISWDVWGWWPDYNPNDPAKSCKFPGLLKSWEVGDYLPAGIDIYNALQTPEPNGSVLTR